MINFVPFAREIHSYIEEDSVDRPLNVLIFRLGPVDSLKLSAFPIFTSLL